MDRPVPDPTAFYVRLHEQTSLDDCARLFRDAVAPYGFDAVACGEVDLSNRDRNVMYFAEWPPDWRRYYFESGFIHRDPVVNALAVFRRPFTFDDIVRDPRFSTMEQQMLRAAAENGWRQGLVASVPRGGPRFGLVSLVGHGAPVNAAEKAGLLVMCDCLLARVRAMVASGAPALAPAKLSARELEALRLVARGLSDSEIAGRLGIAESTAHKHVEGARRRLKAKNRAELAALAASLALIPSALEEA